MAAPRYKWNDKEYPQIPYDDWTSGELSNVEHAFGKALDGGSTGDIAAAMFVVAVMRLEPAANVVMLADVARAMPMKQLAITPTEEEDEEPDEEPDPLEEPEAEPESNGQGDPQTFGHPLSVSSE